MSSLELIKEPNPILYKKSRKIVQITDDIKQLIFAMKKIMKNNNGIGLAAPQVGKNIRLILISTEKGILPLINPVIYRKSLRKDTEEEGCLSCPGANIQIKRSKIIYVKALNQEGQEIKFRAEGLFARVIQHEADHLDGILITNKK